MDINIYTYAYKFINVHSYMSRHKFVQTCTYIPSFVQSMYIRHKIFMRQFDPLRVTGGTFLSGIIRVGWTLMLDHDCVEEIVELFVKHITHIFSCCRI
jgi:hypothetical protein